MCTSKFFSRMALNIRILVLSLSVSLRALEKTTVRTTWEKRDRTNTGPWQRRAQDEPCEYPVHACAGLSTQAHTAGGGRGHGDGSMGKGRSCLATA